LNAPHRVSHSEGVYFRALVFRPLGHAAESYHYCTRSSVFSQATTAGRLNRTALDPIFTDGIVGWR
jgi:hypothetical protein